MQHDRYLVNDISPFIVARKILAKSNPDGADKQSVELSLIDFYSIYLSLDLLEKELLDIEFEVFSSLNAELNEVLSLLSGTEFSPPTKNIPAIEFYNDFLEKKLEFIKDGLRYIPISNECPALPGIHGYDIIRDQNLKVFKVFFSVASLKEVLKVFKEDFNNLQNKLSKVYHHSVPGNAPSIIKQGELFIGEVKNQQNCLGIEQVNINLRGWGMRMTLFDLENTGLMLHPLNMTYRNKADLPIILEVQGCIDIIDISFVNSPQDFLNADVQYTVKYPCCKNIFNTDNTFIPANSRSSLSETEISIIMRIFEKLNSSLIFSDKPNLKQSFFDIIIWFVKKISICLTEEFFLREPAYRFINENTNTYLQMEDRFFHPFIYEKLLDHFGRERVLKKPEMFHGEIDILFDSIIPIELKVWRNQQVNVDDIVDEKFPHINQAATYASLDRICLLAILDISSPRSGINNIESCWRVVSKVYDENQLDTKVVALIFDCNHVAPSRL